MAFLIDCHTALLLTTGELLRHCGECDHVQTHGVQGFVVTFEVQPISAFSSGVKWFRSSYSSETPVRY